MINLSINEFDAKHIRRVDEWLRYAEELPLTIYVKSFLPRTDQWLSII